MTQTQGRKLLSWNLCRELDTKGVGSVNYYDFLAAVLGSNMLVSDDALLKWLFDFIDDNDSDTITRGNLEVWSFSSLVTATSALHCILLLLNRTTLNPAYLKRTLAKTRSQKQ